MTPKNNKSIWYNVKKPSLLFSMSVLLLIVLLIIPQVHALGIRPAKTNLNFEENPTYEGELWVINNDQQDIKIKVSVEGELASAVTLIEHDLSLRAEDDAKPVHFAVNLPSSVPPGLSTATIIIEQRLESKDSNTIASTVIVKHKINVQGPYPEKFILPKLNFHEDENSIRFISEVENKGKKDLEQVKTTFYVNDEKSPQTLTTTETTLHTGENKLLEARLPKSSLKQGEYEVSAVTSYDDQQVEIQKKLIIGEPEINITYLNSYLTANTVNKVTLELINKWNKFLENVFVDITVRRDKIILDTLRTKAIDLPVLLEQNISEYYDARARDPGIYSFDLHINYWNTYVQKDQTFTVELLDQHELSPTSTPTGLAIANTSTTQIEKTSSTTKVMVIIIISLLLIIASYILYRYIHRDEYEQNEII